MIETQDIVEKAIALRPQRDRDRFILLRGSKRKETWRENRYRVIIINGKWHVGRTFRFDRKL